MAEQNKNNDFCSFLKRRNFKSRLKKLTQKLKNKKIVIYGAGQLFEEINRHYDLSGLNIIALADRKFNDYEEEKFLNYPAVSPSKIIELAPDYVLVSTLKYFDVVKTMDKDKFDEKNIKIIPFLGIDFINKIKGIWQIPERTTQNVQSSQLGDLYLKDSEMTLSESEFLKNIILNKKPQKILELGVAAGASSTLILDTIKDFEASRLYSIDFNTEYYRNPQKLTGYTVPEELKSKWQLYTGGLAYKFMEKIGGDIDMCLLDTMHCNPGEILDFLMIYPFLKKDCTVVIHDITRHTQFQNCPDTCCTLFSALTGKKSVPSYTEYKYFPNIGAVELSDAMKENIFNVFMLLMLDWEYRVSDKDIKNLSKYFRKYYPQELVELYEKAVVYSKEVLKNMTEKPNHTHIKQKFRHFFKTFIPNFIEYSKY